jgi:hypothetical protein
MYLVETPTKIKNQLMINLNTNNLITNNQSTNFLLILN